MTQTFISKPSQGARWAISDIHACHKTFWALLEKISLGKGDQLFILGNMINRGPDSEGVIASILKLQGNGYQIHPLRGNHEEMLWQFHSNYRNMVNLPSLESAIKGSNTGLINALGMINAPYVNFFADLPYYYETDDYVLVHAGFNLEGKPSPFDDLKNMLWLKTPTEESAWQTFSPKTLLHGHFSTALSHIQDCLGRRAAVLPIDNGCYKGLIQTHYPASGNLCALNLDRLELVVQENVDKE